MWQLSRMILKTAWAVSHDSPCHLNILKLSFFAHLLTTSSMHELEIQVTIFTPIIRKTKPSALKKQDWLDILYQLVTKVKFQSFGRSINIWFWGCVRMACISFSWMLSIETLHSSHTHLCSHTSQQSWSGEGLLIALDFSVNTPISRNLPTLSGICTIRSHQITTFVPCFLSYNIAHALQRLQSLPPHPVSWMYMYIAVI